MHDYELFIRQYAEKHRLLPAAIEYLLAAAEAPSRTVGDYATGSVSGAFASMKMRCAIYVESRTGEFAFALLCEFDPRVILYFEQPGPLEVVRTDRRGYRRTTIYTPDFVVLMTDGPVVIQVKGEDELRRRVEQNPEDWGRTDGGGYCDRPADEALKELGFRHLVVSTKDLPRVRVANLSTLYAVRQSGFSLEPTVRKRIIRSLRVHGVMTLAALLHAAGLRDYTAIYHLIDEGAIRANLDDQLLTNREDTYVSTELALLNLANEHAKSGTTALPAKPVRDTAQSASEPMAILLERRLQRLAEPGSSRQKRRLNALARDADTPQKVFEVLIPKRCQQGNRDRKRQKRVLTFATTWILTKHFRPGAQVRSAAYREYLVDAKAHHPRLLPLTRPTFYGLIAKNTTSKAIESSGGKRKAHAMASPTDVALRAIPAQRPFEGSCFDHWQVDIESIVFVTEKKKYTARPWLSVMVDAATGAVLAYWLWFRRPSRDTLTCLLRQCAALHGRLPEAVHGDRGAEYLSPETRMCLARFSISAFQSPAANSRFNGHAEGLFKQFRDYFAEHQPGRVPSITNRRSVSRSHQPDRLARLTFVDLYRVFSAFMQEYASVGIGRNGKSPSLMLQELRAAFPFSGRKVELNDAFLLATSLCCRRIKVEGNKGIEFNDRHYWAPELSRFHGQRLDVRPEPWDPTRVYVKCGDVWAVARSSRGPEFDTYAEATRRAQAVVDLSAGAVLARAKMDASIAMTRSQRLIEVPMPTRPMVDVPAVPSEQSGSSSPYSVDDPLPPIDWEGGA